MRRASAGMSVLGIIETPWEWEGKEMGVTNHPAVKGLETPLFGTKILESFHGTFLTLPAPVSTLFLVMNLIFYW
jgi:hypothetical protein